MKPLCIDLFCGLGGWAEGFLAEGWDVIGFDIERHDYGTGGYPGHLVLQDVLTLDGAQFRNADCIVASPPCQAYSYRAMPWKRAKALPPPDNTLFEACFRIQREASEAAGRWIPLVVENVCGAQRWVGRATWHFGSYFLWGDVPAIMPAAFTRAPRETTTARLWLETTLAALKDEPSAEWADFPCLEWPYSTKGAGYGHLYREGKLRAAHRESWEFVHGPIPEGMMVLHRCDNPPCIRPAHLFLGTNADNLADCSTKGRMHPGEANPGAKLTESQVSDIRRRLAEGAIQRQLAAEYRISTTAIWKLAHELKWKESPINGKGFTKRFEDMPMAWLSSKSNARKAASAQIAKIPFPLASWIARVYKP